MAHIFRKGKHQWQARYVGPDGRRHSKTFARKVDAERFLATAETAKLQGEWTDPRLGRTTVGEWVKEWRTGTVHLKPKTVEGYESLLRCHLLPRFGEAALAAVTTAQLKAWVAVLVEGGLGASRVRNAYRLMALIMQAAVDSGYLARSPCRGIKLPPLPKKEMRVLTVRQIDELAYAIAPPYAVLVYVLAYGGLRWGEACALRRRRCHLERSRVWIAESLSEVNGKLIFGPTKTYAER